jgi:hypothetical protein
VGVYAEGRPRVRVAETAAHCLHVLAAGKQDGRGEVPEIVEPHAWKGEIVAQSAERERHIPGTPRNLSGWIVREHEVVGAKDRAELGAEAEARGSMLSQALEGSRVEANPACRVRLRVLLDEFALPVLDD